MGPKQAVVNKQTQILSSMWRDFQESRSKYGGRGAGLPPAAPQLMISTFWSTLGLKERTFDKFWFSAEWTQISASAATVPLKRGLLYKSPDNS